MPSRRRFLSLAAAGTVAGISGVTGVKAQSQPETIRLGGEIAGWQGRAPESIAGETNPTLQLEAGTTYQVVWENLDGMGHNFVLLDSDGNALERTDVMSEEGQTQSLTFTAREEMVEYVCQPHISTMNGAVSFSGESGNTTTTSTTTVTESTDAETAPLIPAGASIRVETIADGDLTAPLDFAVPPGGTRKFIVDRFGQVYVLDEDGLREEPFIDVSDQLTEITGEMGLLGMTFHPEFRQNRRFYLRYSAPSREGTPENFDHTEVLAEFTASDDGATGRLDSERTLLEIPSPYDTHNSGAITFGSDGYLYLGMGDGGGGHDRGLGHVADWYERFDGGSGPDVAGNGQDVTENLLGSILRLDVDDREGEKPYGIPDDNPLVGEPGLDEQFAWGFRNPWRMGFSNGDLFVADVGQSLYEEVSIVESGGNYGWNIREGTHCFKPGPEGSRNPPAECPERTPPDVRGGEPLRDPVIEYPHTHDGTGIGSAVIGGYVYENSAVEALNGKYVFGDYRKTADTEVPTGSLFAATPAEDGLWSLEELTVENTESGLLGAYLLAFGRDNDGGLYALTTEDPGGDSTGAVHRIRPPNNAAQGDTTASTTTRSPTNATASNTTATAPTPNGTPANTTTVASTSNSSTNTTNRTQAETLVSDSSALTASTATTESETAATENTNSVTDGGSTTTNSSGSGPGFGALAAVSGLAIWIVRLLTNSDRE